MDGIKLTGLWKGKTTQGKPMLSGQVNPGMKLIIFVNDFKKNENDPDYTAYLVPVEKKNAATGRSAPPPGEDDLPF